MSQLLKHFGLPLLGKELLEQSSRKRTYVIRMIYALSLYGMAIWTFRTQLGSWSLGGFGVLGRGHDLFTSVAWLQFLGIYIFLPAISCSVLTSEKERDTLGLLLLTKLGPWTIIFEKLFGRLIPMATFVLLSLPLLAVAYSLGGIESGEITKLMWILAMTAIQVGSFAVLCSAWFRTTSAAFMATYMLGVIGVIATGFVCEFARRHLSFDFFPSLLSDPAHKWLFDADVRTTVGYELPWILVHRGLLLGFGPSILNGNELIATEVKLSEQTFLDCLVMTLPMFAGSICCLSVARAVIWRRAFLRPANPLMKLFRSLDAMFQRFNQNRLTRGIVLIHESVALPLYHPISWRETSKRTLGTTRYLVRLLLMLEIPVLVMLLWPAGNNPDQSVFIPVYLTEWCLWFVVTLVLSVQSTGLIGVERSHQTLDVLLTTPLESDEIIRQKFAGTWRMIRMLWVPFGTLYAFQIWWESNVNTFYGYSAYQQPVSANFVVLRAVLAVCLYPATIVWFGFNQGLRRRSQTQAILVTMTVITTLCVIPPIIGWCLTPAGVPYDQGSYHYLLSVAIPWLSPAVALATRPDSNADWAGLIFHFSAVSVVYLWLSNSTRKAFGKCVGRIEGSVLEGEYDEEMPVAALNREDRMSKLRSGQFGLRSSDRVETSETTRPKTTIE